MFVDLEGQDKEELEGLEDQLVLAEDQLVVEEVHVEEVHVNEVHVNEVLEDQLVVQGKI